MIKTGRIRMPDQELADVEVEMEVKDIFGRQKRELVIDSPRSQAIFCAGGWYFDSVAEGQRWHSCRLPVKPDLRTDPIVTETLVSPAPVSLRQERGCAPAQLDVTKDPKLHKTTN